MTDQEDPKSSKMSTDDNVANIKDARRKKSGVSSYKPSQAEICRLLAEAVARSPASLLPDFPKHYEIIEPKPGISIPVAIGKDESISVTLPRAIANDILRFCDRQLVGRRDFTIKPRQAADVADYFLGSHPPLDQETVKLTRWANEPGLTYRRLPWVKQTGDTPTWNALLSRMSNNQAFIDWVGSLFFEQAYLHNYVWLYGEGGDGKGAINRFLSKIFDTSYRSKTAPTVDRNGSVDKFWAYNLIGARLAVFPDCENATFTTSGFFKSLTGGDPVEVEAKGSMGFTVYLNTRYMILANVKPAITSARSNIRRIIYCEMEPTDQDWGGVEKQLWEEGGFFISQCIDNYLSKYPQHGPIQTDQTSLIDVIDENEQHLENFFNEYFELVPDSFTLAKDLKIAAEEVWPRQRKTYREFLAWLKRVHGIEYANERLSCAKMERVYRGIGRKKVVFAQKIGKTTDCYV